MLFFVFSKVVSTCFTGDYRGNYPVVLISKRQYIHIFYSSKLFK